MPFRMPCAALLLAFLTASPIRAQNPGYVALDDPDLPLIELLIQRNVIPDPTPLQRPFHGRELLASLDSANPVTLADRALVERLKQRWLLPRPSPQWAADARGGLEAYSTPRRDVLHPVGDEGIQPYAEVDLRGSFGVLALRSRAAAEPRVTDDPDWPGRRNLKIPTRMLDAYISADAPWIQLVYGQMPQNWGPSGLDGIPLSAYGYERQGLLMHLGTRRVRLSAMATDLRDAADSSGAVIHRYYFLHRLAVTLNRRVTLAAWEANVLSGADRQFETRYRNPLSVSYLANTIGLGDRGNVMLGLDARIVAARGVIVEGQFGLDDLWIQDREQNRDRYLFTIAASGRLGAQAGWRAMYSQASSLALRTFEPADNFLDADVGLGRNFTDNDHLKVAVGVPYRARWLITPELALLRQGEGDPRMAYPEGQDLVDAPTLFIGTVERTFRVAVGVSGSEGPLQLAGDIGLHRVSNAGHIAGTTRTDVAFRVKATLGVGARGTIPQ